MVAWLLPTPVYVTLPLLWCEIWNRISPFRTCISCFLAKYTTSRAYANLTRISSFPFCTKYSCCIYFVENGKDEIRGKIRLCAVSSILMLKLEIHSWKSEIWNWITPYWSGSHIAHFYVKRISPWSKKKYLYIGIFLLNPNLIFPILHKVQLLYIFCGKWERWDPG